MAKQTAGTRYRSKFASYRWKGVGFTGNIATVSDARTNEAMQNDPHFGEGRDFWIDADVAPTDETAGNSDDKSAAAKTGGKGPAKGK